jgi:hypothetical protein
MQLRYGGPLTPGQLTRLWHHLSAHVRGSTSADSLLPATAGYEREDGRCDHPGATGRHAQPYADRCVHQQSSPWDVLIVINETPALR